MSFKIEPSHFGAQHIVELAGNKKAAYRTLDEYFDAALKQKGTQVKGYAKNDIVGALNLEKQPIPIPDANQPQLIYINK